MAATLAHTLQPHVSDTALRHVAGAVVGLCVTAGLFWSMQYLIDSADREWVEEPLRATLDILRVERDETIRTKTPPPAIPPASNPPPMPRPADLGSDTPTIAVTDLGSPDIPLGDGFGPGLFDGYGEGDYLPIVKVEPIYPTRALARGIEGHCVIQFTVTRHGTVRDPFVVESQCTHSVFHRASLEAVLKFKYRPRVTNGVAMEVSGVQNRFVFRITD